MSDRPPLPLSKSAIRLDGNRMEVDDKGRIIGTAVRACEDPMHIFAEWPGWCQCGERFYEGDTLTSDDIPAPTKEGT